MYLRASTTAAKRQESKQTCGYQDRQNKSRERLGCSKQVSDFHIALSAPLIFTKAALASVLLI
ncbi:MAG: hypothetical protein OXG80_08705, partial [Chloroflexi bacterium]|nr:hypothetical protein [Chloroflexota bacterium]